MSLSITIIDQKITDLKLKKKHLEIKQAQNLFKVLSSEIGEDFSSQLVVCIFKDVWRKASRDQKEKWSKTTENFPLSPSRKTHKAAQSRAATDSSI